MCPGKSWSHLTRLHVDGLSKELLSLYDLRLLETFEIKSLQQNIALIKSQGNGDYINIHWCFASSNDPSMGTER